MPPFILSSWWVKYEISTNVFRLVLLSNFVNVCMWVEGLITLPFFFFDRVSCSQGLTQTCCVPKNDLEIFMRLPSLFKCWDCKCVQPRQRLKTLPTYLFLCLLTMLIPSLSRYDFRCNILVAAILFDILTPFAPAKFKANQYFICFLPNLTLMLSLLLVLS